MTETPPADRAGYLESGVHRLSVRIYYEDTDASGIVYHARYLAFFERGRTEMLRAIGIAQRPLLALPADERFGFAVRRAEIDYLAPAVLDDLLLVTTRIASVGGASIDVEQGLIRDQKTLSRARVRVAAVDGNGRVKRLPREMRRQMEATIRAQTTSDNE